MNAPLSPAVFAPKLQSSRGSPRKFNDFQSFLRCAASETTCRCQPEAPEGIECVAVCLTCVQYEGGDQLKRPFKVPRVQKELGPVNGEIQGRASEARATPAGPAASEPAVFLYADSPCQNSFIQRAFSSGAGYDTKIVAFTVRLEKKNIWNANAMRTRR